MFLQRLSEYSERIELPPALYSENPVRYIIELNAAGVPLTPQPIDTADPSNRSTRRGQRRLVPQVKRTSAIRPLLLADTAPYTLGLPREDKNPEREALCHQAYLELLERCAHRTEEPAVEAVLHFLRSQPLEQLHLPEGFDRGATVTFRVDGVFPVDLPSVQRFWVQENTPSDDTAQPLMECIVCGRERPALSRLKGSIKGIPGGHTAGTAIISANEDAYESYGLKASHIAPICADCAERMTNGLNDLLRDDAHHLRMGNTVFVFWTREETTDDFRQLLASPDPADVRDLIASVYGRSTPPVEENRFYAALLSASGGRAVVRNWIDSTLGQVKRNLAHWFRCQAIVQPWGEPSRPLGVYALAGATVRELRDLPSPTLKALLESALLRHPLPPGILYQAVGRTRAEQGVNHAQAAVIKLALSLRKTGPASPEAKEDPVVQLDKANATPAYLCGRLLAVLEQAQYYAIPGARTTLVDRYYGTASAAPGTVFGSLMRGAQAHLSKLQRDKRGAYLGIQAELEEIMAGLERFPRTLSLHEQALFALGYYHQRAHHRARAREATQAKEAEA